MAVVSVGTYEADTASPEWGPGALLNTEEVVIFVAYLALFRAETAASYTGTGRHTTHKRSLPGRGIVLGGFVEGSHTSSTNLSSMFLLDSCGWIGLERNG